MKEIILPNRYGAINRLRLIKEKKGLLYYKFTSQEEDFMRIIAGENNSFAFPDAIDPSGGPYMSLGWRIENLKLIKILNRKGIPIILIFEKV